jgi:hypothetical protein
MAGEGEEADGKADTAWIARVKEEEKREMTKTEIDLRGYMSNLIKESIRVSISCSSSVMVRKLRIGDTPRNRSNGYQERRPSCCTQGIRQRKGILDKSKSSPRTRSRHTRSRFAH